MKSTNYRYFICKILFIIIIISLTFLVFSLLTETCRSSEIPDIDGDILYVGGSGSGNYTTIQDAINDSANGDAVYVYNGTYFENIIVNKSIYLVGENRENTIINGGGCDTVVTISADQVNVSGFNIQNGNDSGLFINHSPNSTVSGNTIINNHYGIHFWYSSNNTITENNISNNTDYGIYISFSWLESNNNTILDNTISNNNYGIHLEYSRNNTITENNISNNYYGIDLWDYSSNNTITENNITNNNYGINLDSSISNNISDNTLINNGISIDYSNINTVTGNYINNNYGYGITLDSSNNNTITENNITNNNCGITLDSSNNNIVTRNNIKNNGNGIGLSYSSSNTITENNITNNDFFGIKFEFSINNTIIENNITNHYYGIWLWYTSNNNTISNNNITNNNYGIHLLDFPHNNTITENNITNNICGICLCECSNNNISNNTFIKDGLYIGNTEHNIISNNTVNGLPLVYLEGETDQTINYNAGQIILVNCNNITIQNQEINNTIAAIQLLNTNNSLITNNNINNNTYGFGICLFYSSNNNTITENNINNNTYGIALVYSSNNTITENNINNNEYGIYISYLSDNNILYHNNFINNIENAEDYEDNYWNSSFEEGNYWDDYTGTDENYDNIGDSPYDIPSGNNQDLYPLMNPWGTEIVESGHTGRSSSSGSPPNQNQHPKADASNGEPYIGFVGENITFDGLNSSDTDGEIVSYFWDFGDGNNGTGNVTNHSYEKTGTYNITLTVEDNDGATDTCITNCTISEQNRPPSKPELTGPEIGYKNNSYNFTVVSTDPDNHPIRYIFDAGDNTNNTITEYVPNDTSVQITHLWIQPGEYLIKVYAEDEYNQKSEITELAIIILSDTSAASGEGTQITNNENNNLWLILGAILIFSIILIKIFIHKRDKNRWDERLKRVRAQIEHSEKLLRDYEQYSKKYQLLKLMYDGDIDAKIATDNLGISTKELEDLVSKLLDEGFLKNVSNDELELTEKGIKYAKSFSN